MADSEDEDSKTEEPTQKKIDEAIQKGDVAKSQELSTFFVLAAGTVFVAFLSKGVASDLARSLSTFIDHADQIPTDARSMERIFLHLAGLVGGVLALPALLFLIAGVGGNAMQHRLLFTFEPLIPKLSKISPISGFKRLFSVDGLVQGLKGVVKIAIVAAAIAFALQPEFVHLQGVVAAEPIGVLEMTRRAAVKLMGAVLVVMTFVAGLDYLFQRHRWMKKLRMTREELKEEFKQTEGNPEIKGKIRQMRAARARRRMMAAVPTATVVVTNPTHFAVALKYDAGMRAPMLVAKGADDVALKIREIATLNEVPIVENPPLARALHASVDLDKEIPEEHYRAVAEVIGFVMRLKDKKRR